MNTCPQITTLAIRSSSTRAWVADPGERALARLGVGTGPRPTEATIRRAFARLDTDLLDRVLGAFLWTRTRVVQGRRVLAIDGKTVRGGLKTSSALS